MYQGRMRFWDARRKAQREDLFARLTGREDKLLPYEPLAQVLQAYQQIPHEESQPIPLNRIVGSVGRYRDFTRGFLPRSGVHEDRWLGVDLAMSGLEGLPPIEVYKIGDVYFVSDGNHRVSVARASGYRDIDAYVTEILVDVELKPGDTLDQAIIKAECANFLFKTGLAARCADLDICFTRPGGFPDLLEHIEVHRYFMGLDDPECKQMTFTEASLDWYNRVYTPIVAAIRQHDLLSRFPGRTAADLYIWVSGRIFELHRLYGTIASPDEVVSSLKQEVPNPFSAAVRGMIERLAQLAGEVIGPGGLAPEWALATLADGEPETPGTTQEKSE